MGVVMTVSRGWTWLEDVTEDQMDDVALDAEINALAARWNALSTELEEESFSHQAQIEDMGYVPGEEDEDIGTEMLAKRRIDKALKHAELQKIEEMLHDRGARLKRPYEHWNEDEKLMEYLERDRDYE